MAVRWALTLALLPVLHAFSLGKFKPESRFSLKDLEELPLPGLSILSELNPLYTDRGEKIVEGDIVVPRRKGIWGGKSRSKGKGKGKGIFGPQETKGAVNYASLWTRGRVPYIFHTSVEPETRDLIKEAMAEWEKTSCLKFTERMENIGFLRFRGDKQGCFSMIGRINSPFGQDVSIGKGCNRLNIIVHEIGHAIGFYHEQSRNDRDQYIQILWHNMPVRRYSQFDKGVESPRGVEYDYTSIMHYGAMAFTEKYYQKNTIAAKNIHNQLLVGSGSKISFRDAKLINKMYTCSSGCPNSLNDTECENGGFMSPYRGKGEMCQCVCPPGIEGEFCETVVDAQYYPSLVCGGNITEETELQTPGYPDRTPPSDSCSWWIQAPENKHAQVEFIDFSFHPRLESNTSRWTGMCVYERVEIRTRSTYDGDMFCGEDIPPGTVATSAEREFIIIIDSRKNYQKGRGLRAKVTFVDETPTKKSSKG